MKWIMAILIAALSFGQVAPALAQEQPLPAMPLVVEIGGTTLLTRQANEVCQVDIEPINNPAQSAPVEEVTAVFQWPPKVWIPFALTACPVVPHTQGFRGTQPERTVVQEGSRFALITGIQGIEQTLPIVSTMSLSITMGAPTNGIVPLRIVAVAPFYDTSATESVAPAEGAVNDVPPDIVRNIERVEWMSQNGWYIHVPADMPLARYPIPTSDTMTPRAAGYEGGVYGIPDIENIHVRQAGPYWSLWVRLHMSPVYLMYPFEWLQWAQIWPRLIGVDDRDMIDEMTVINRNAFQLPVTLRLPEGTLEPGTAWAIGWPLIGGGTLFALYALTTAGGRALGGGGLFEAQHLFQQ